MKRYALCIGINDYPGTDADLAGCVNDARDWREAFRARGCEVEVLLDRQATGNGIRGAVERLVGRARRGDLVVVQFSGHGSFVTDRDGDEADGRDECLCPWDVVRNGPVRDDELAALLRSAVRGVRVVLLADSCHSGTVSRRLPAARGERRLRVRFLPPSLFAGKARWRAGVGMSAAAGGAVGLRAAVDRRAPGLLLAGCQDDEYSYDAWFGGRPNGAFSFAALRALEALPREATCQRWFAAIRKALPSAQHPQTPNLVGSQAMRRWRLWA